MNIEENKSFNKYTKMDILQPAIGMEVVDQEKNTWLGFEVISINHLINNFGARKFNYDNHFGGVITSQFLSGFIATNWFASIFSNTGIILPR